MGVYFDILDNKNVVELCRFRTANNKLPIEIGRWNNTNRNKRMCTHCNKNELDDEFHYILDSLSKIELSTYQSITTVDQLF
jgi:superfamily II helicase